MSVPSLRRRMWVPALLAALAGGCGIVLYDTSSRALFLEPVERIVFESDSGSVEVYAFNRTAITILYYLTGSDTGIDEIDVALDGDDLRAVIACDGDECNANFSCEVPLGTEVVIRADNGGVRLIGVDAKISAVVAAGDVEGIKLRSPAIDLEVEAGNVNLELAVVEAVDIAVEAGTVALTVPAGSYRCELDAADGKVTTTGVTCDPSATATVTVKVQTGDITLQAAAP